MRGSKKKRSLISFPYQKATLIFAGCVYTLKSVRVTQGSCYL